MKVWTICVSVTAGIVGSRSKDEYSLIFTHEYAAANRQMMSQCTMH